MRESSGKGIVTTLILSLLVCPMESARAGDSVIVDRRKQGYRLRASSAWKVKENPGQADSELSMVNPPCWLNVLIAPAQGRSEITEFQLKRISQNFAASYANTTFLKQKLETHRGKPSGWYEFTGEFKQAPGVLFHFRQYLTLHRDQIYAITVWAPEDSWRKSESEWQQIVRSMEFL